MYPLKTPIKYQPGNLANSANVYTTVYLGNYIIGDFDEGSGSHPGVDIMPMNPKAPVYAVLEGEVIEATKKASEGNFVLIKHRGVGGKVGNAGTFYSCYLHLDSFCVSKGDRVSEGDEIGRSGNTGLSTGEHLHFQIDTWDAPFHPYWPFSTQEANNLGLGFFDAVNKGLGIDKAQKYTVNPLVFLDELEKNKIVALQKTDTLVDVIKPVPTTDTITVHEIQIASEPKEGIFTDVLESDKYFKEIQYVSQTGISQGNGGKFCPEDTITRGELMKMAFKTAKKPLSQDKNTHFKDVPVSSEFLPYINTAYEMGIVQGYSDGTFGLSRSVTRAEGLKILLGLLGIQPEEASGPVYLDVSKIHWFASYALWSRDNEVLEPQGSNFNPNKPLTRGEVARIIFVAQHSQR